MGAFKPLLPFGSKTVIDNCIGNLRGGGIQNIIVVVGYSADDIRDQVKNYDVRFALNNEPDSAMSVSIARGIEQVDEAVRAVMMALVDYPAVPSIVIKSLIREWRK